MKIYVKYEKDRPMYYKPSIIGLNERHNKERFT